MAIYAIVLTETTDEIVSRIQKKFPHCYQLMDKTVFLLRSEDVSGNVATSIGLKGDEQIDEAAGAVLKLNGAYSGYADASLWEWLEEGEDN